MVQQLQRNIERNRPPPPAVAPVVDANSPADAGSDRPHSGTGAGRELGVCEARQLDWAAVAAHGAAALRRVGNNSSALTTSPCDGQLFDVVLASEVIYEEEHAPWVAAVLGVHKFAASVFPLATSASS